MNILATMDIFYVDAHLQSHVEVFIIENMADFEPRLHKMKARF